MFKIQWNIFANIFTKKKNLDRMKHKRKILRKIIRFHVLGCDSGYTLRTCFPSLPLPTTFHPPKSVSPPT